MAEDNLGLKVVSGVIVAFMILAILATTIFLLNVSLVDVYERIDVGTGSITNETFDLADTWDYLSVDGLRKVTLGNVIVTNASGGETLTSSNYTIDAGSIKLGIEPSLFNNTEANISATYTYSESNAHDIAGNISTAVTDDFFNNTGTIFSILVVIVIIMAIGIVIFTVRNFGAGAGAGAL